MFSIKNSLTEDHLYTLSLQYKLILRYFFKEELLTSILNVVLF